MVASGKQRAFVNKVSCFRVKEMFVPPTGCHVHPGTQLHRAWKNRFAFASEPFCSEFLQGCRSCSDNATSMGRTSSIIEHQYSWRLHGEDGLKLAFIVFFQYPYTLCSLSWFTAMNNTYSDPTNSQNCESQSKESVRILSTCCYSPPSIDSCE